MSATKTLLPCVEKFLKDYSEYGRPVEFADLPEWARGKRQGVTCETDKGRERYVFYENHGRVETVYRRDAQLGNVVMFGNYRGAPYP